MAQYLPLPDGSSLKLREGESPAEGWARAQQMYPEAFARATPTEEPKGGFVPATKAGIASLKSDIAALLGRTGAIDIPTAEKYMQEQEEYQRRVFKPTEKGWTEAPGTKISELLGGSLPYMVAPVAAGAATLAAPVTGAAATALGLGAAGLTSAAQFTGSNIQRQVAEGARLAETELGAAAAAAVPQAALDLVSFRMMPGIRRIFMQAGKEVPEAAAKKIAEQQVADIAKDYALATGKSMGVEGLTEASQQVFERLQAGLNIADPAARSEYFDSFIGGAVLGGAISPAGRFIERGAEKRKQEEQALAKRVEEERKLAAEKDKVRAAELGAPLLTAEEAERPLFVDEKGKAAAFTDLAERERQLAEREEAKKDAQEQYTEITKTINNLREQSQKATPEQAIVLGRDAQRLDALKTQLEARTKDKEDPIYKTKLVSFTQLTQEKADEALTTYDALQKKIKQMQGQFEKARDQGDVIAQGKAAEKIQSLEAELRGTTPDLFGIESQQQIAEKEKVEAKETKTKEEILKQREKLAEAKPAKDAFYELMSQKADEERYTEKQREIEQRQGKALERLEFGLNRMGLSVLGVTGEERVKAEVDLGKGIVSPNIAEKLGLEKITESTRAVDMLPNIEAAYEKASTQQKDTVNELAQDQISLFDAEGKLTEDGKLAVANEAILRQLADLRRLGRESKETMEAQRAEDLFAAAPTKSEAETERRGEAFGKAVTKAGEPIPGIPEKQLIAEAERGPAYTSRNEAFADFSDAAIKLQRGEFLGKRPDLISPETERRREAELQKKIDKVQDDLTYLRGQQTRVGKQQAPAIQRRIAQLEGREKTLKAGLSQTKAEKLTARKLLIQKAERSADFLINNAINEVKANRLARGLGDMPASEARDLETRLRIEFNRFMDRVIAAERQLYEFEKKPVTKVIDGKKVTRTELVPKKPDISRQPYEKLKVALGTLRNELEATVTEAKGLPAKGEFAEEPVEVAKPVKEKPVKTTKKKIAERERAIKREVKKAEAIEAGKKVIPENQQKIRVIENKLRTTGAEVARLKKAALKDKNPQMRLAKVERLEAQMDSMRDSLAELKNTNKALAAAMRTLGVETGRVRSGAYILDMIENDQYLVVEELAEAGLGEKTVARVEQLQKIRSKQESEVKAIEAKLRPMERRLSLLTLFSVADAVKTKAQLRKDIDVQKRLLSQAKSEVNKTQRELYSYISRGTGEQAKQGVTTPRFTPYEIDLAAKFLMSRIDQVIARMNTAQKTIDETDRLIKAQLGTITTPEGKTLPGMRVTTEMQWSPQALNETAQQERELYQKQYEDAAAERDAIADRLRAAGKSVRGNEEYEKAAAKARSYARAKKAVKDFDYGYVPIRTKQEIFASTEDVGEVLGQRQRQTADFVQDKPEDAIEVAKDTHAMLVEDVRLAEQALANIPVDDKIAQKKAKAALANARNRLSKGSIYQLRAALTPEELESTIKQSEENSNTVTRKRKGKPTEIYTAGVLDIDPVGFSDADIIDSIDYKSDEIDPRIGEPATEIIDEKEAVALLDKVKAKAEAQGIEFEYYDSIAKLPIGILKQMAKQGMDVVASQLKGGVYKGKVFVIVQNHNDMTDLQQTLAHELIGHYSVDGLLGKDGLIKLSQQIYKTPGGLEKIAKELGLLDVVNGVFFDTVKYYKKAFDDGKITDAQIRANANIKAMREMIAYTMEKEVTASRMQKLGYWYKALVGAVRAALRKLGFDMDITTSDLFYLMKQAKRNFEAGKPVAYRNADDTISFRTVKGTAPPATGMGAIVAERGKMFDTVKANVTGLNFRTQFVDRLAALDALVKRGVSKGVISSLKAMDVLYFGRMADQRNNFVAQFATSGVGKIVKKNGEFMYEGGEGPSLKDVSEALKDSGVPTKQVENEFTQYEIALRAKDVGVDKLDFTGKKITQKDVDDTIAKYANNAAFKKAHELFQQYNRDLIDLAVASGALDSKLAAELKAKNYVPYYRQRNGVAELVVFGEQPIRIGDIKNQPYLEQLVGGEEKILPIFTGALQNTQLLVDMALKNMATRNAAFVLQEMGVAEIHKGKGPADPTSIRFKVDGKDMWARIDTKMKEDLFGDIPAELVVKGMEGIKATLPVGIRLLGMPANLLRKFVTRDPRYAVRQVFRDSMSAVLTTGADFVPVYQTLKDMVGMKRTGTMEVLQGRGILGGQVVVGATDDMSKILQQLASGKPGWDMAMAKLDEFAMMGDAATRVSMYNSFLKQGLSEREATFATLEAMNFSRRGLSPTILYANTLIPFFNAGVQGLDVLYRAYKGDMVASEKLRVRNKLFMRMGMMAALTMFYAAMMDDDETYENANPDERYNNWFVPTPLGTFRVPIPFEAGLIAKGLPEGVYRMAFTDDKNADVLKALKDLAMRSLPGDMPTAIKPVVELMLNRSFFTGREIVDKSMSQVAEYQYRPNTPETIKLFGELGISPAKVEYFIKGYTGSLPLGIIGAVETVTGIKSAEKEAPAMRIYEAPIVGGLFQPPDASGMINRAYETVNRAQSAQQTYNRLSTSDPKEADKFLKENMQDINISSAAGAFRQEMGEIAAYERFIRDSKTMTADQKRERLDKMKQLKIKMSKQFNEMNARIELQAAR